MPIVDRRVFTFKVHGVSPDAVYLDTRNIEACELPDEDMHR